MRFYLFLLVWLSLLESQTGAKSEDSSLDESGGKMNKKIWRIFRLWSELDIHTGMESGFFCTHVV